MSVAIISMFCTMHAHRARTVLHTYCPAHRYITKSLESYPALPARTVGICRNQCANGSTAITLFLLAFLAVSSTARFIGISEHPSPRTMRVSLTIWGSTESASFALIDYLIRGAMQDNGG
ncbi:hypothetical protein SCLCIDRAFT_1223340 [Scleroderma citrinum Foug A]|uniref:Uncharacterized protein n=1 Tax=Scleroderma citrinum Foug A TaxID=1036808 RepID=A0A0C3CWJ5_9AGAM|nr:hypothetical protein SCLCIDRAFT_1223340 [Scleroderma citrinum Foug A]